MPRSQPGYVAPGNQVEGLIPFYDEQGKANELLELRLAQIKSELDAVLTQSLLIQAQNAAAFLACTNRIDSAAGVIPGIRAARARVAGLLLSSFCRSSLESPSIPA